MKTSIFIAALLLLASCGSKSDKTTDGQAPVAEESVTETSLLGNIPAIYGKAYDETRRIQEEIQNLARTGAGFGPELSRKLIDIPKEAKTEAEKVSTDLIGTKIPVEGGDYGFVKISHAEVSNVKFYDRSGDARIYIRLVPDAGYDLKSLPKGSTVYYLFLTEDNTLLYKSAMFFPSEGITSISITANPGAKTSPAVWGKFAKIHLVSKEDFYKMSSMR